MDQLSILKFIQQVKNPVLDVLMEGITILGEEEFYILALTLIFWCVNRMAGYGIAFSFLSSGALNAALKLGFHIERPIGEEGIVSMRLETAGGYAFPSGHTQGAASFWTAAMVQVKKRWMTGLGTALILLVGLSRLYLGVHWPVDIAGGIFFGIITALAAGALFSYAEKSGRRYLMLILPVLAATGLFFFEDANYWKSSGTLIGAVAGYLLESRYIRFNPNAGLLMQFGKYVSGVAVIFLLKMGVKAVLPELLISDLIRYILIGLWVTAGAPFLFTHLTGKARRAESAGVSDR